MRDVFKAAHARQPEPYAEVPDLSNTLAVSVIVQHLRTKDDQLAFAEQLCLAIEESHAADPIVKFFGEHAATELSTLSDDEQYTQLLWLVDYCRSDRPVRRRMVDGNKWPLYVAFTSLQAAGHRPRRTQADPEIEEDDDEGEAPAARQNAVAAFTRKEVADAGAKFLVGLHLPLISLANMLIQNYTDGHSSLDFDIDEIYDPLSLLVIGVSVALNAGEDNPLRVWKREATDLPTLLGMPALAGRSLGIRLNDDGQSTCDVIFTGMSAAVDNILLRALPAALDELGRNPEVLDRHVRLYATKLAAIQDQCLPQARAANVDPPRNVRARLEPCDVRDRPAPDREHISLAQLRCRIPGINDELDRLIDDGPRHPPAAAAASSLPPRAISGARGGRSSAGRDATEDDSAGTMPSARLYFGPKESDILYPINFTDRNRAEPGVEQGVRLRIDTDTGATEFFTAKASAGKRPLSALEMLAAREKIRRRCCSNIRANAPSSWSAAKLEATLNCFNDAYGRYIHGTLMPHYTKSGNNEAMLRAIQDFDSKLFAEIYLRNAQLDEPNSYNYLVVEKIFSVMSTPAPRPATDRSSAATCRHYNQPAGCKFGDSCTNIHKCSACGSTTHSSVSCHKRRGGGGGNRSGGGGGGYNGGGQRQTKAGRSDRAADGGSDRSRGRR
jgi:hypothetical protein